MNREHPSVSMVMALAVLLAAGVAHAAGQTEAFIVKDGQARAEIVVAGKPTRSASLAAGELQTYLEKMSGATLKVVTKPSGDVPVRIYVGQSEHTDKLNLKTDDLKHGAFHMVSGPGWLALIGNDADFEPHDLHGRTIQDRARVRAEFDRRVDARWGLPIDKTDRRHHAETGWWQDDRRGSLNAVHDFLRDLGVRWFMPGELGEVVPRLNSIRLPHVDRTMRPDFAMRYHDCNRWDLISRVEILWYFRLGLNWGGEFLGHGRRHAIQAVLAREDMKRQHPDYYALWEGKRQTDYLGEGAPCLSSEGLLREHVQYVRAMFDIFDEPMLDIAIPDNMGKTGKVCECERCKPQYNLKRPFGGISDYVWGYMNRVAEEVAKTHPEKKVFAYAYQNALLPPERIERLHPNLAVVIATVWRHKRLHPDLNPPGKRDIDAIRRAWADKVGSGVLFNWEYYLYPRPKADGLHGVPVYFPHGIADDLRALKAIPGMRGEFMEVTRNDPKTLLPESSTPWGTRGELYAPGFSHLNIYITSRLYWDTAQDVDALLADYYTKFYGPAAKQMQAFVEFCERNWPRLAPPVPDRETLRHMQQLLSAARHAAGDSVHGRRIDLVVEYTRPLQPGIGS